MELTRRNFIVGAGVAAGASALAGLAGCSSQGSASSSASATETKEASKAAEGARWSWDVKPDLPSDDEIVETYDCDICVCGLGVAGPLAMYYAMQKGYNVVALQKLECMHNGGGGCGVFNTKDPENEPHPESWTCETKIRRCGFLCHRTSDVDTTSLSRRKSRR